MSFNTCHRMKTVVILVLPLLLGSAGCTTLSLARHTVNQSQSATDYRYQAALHALAMVADNPATLPSYALLSGGLTSLTNTGTLSDTVNLKGRTLYFVSDALALTGSHVPMIQWTVSPVADHTQLEAMRCACNFVLAGPERLPAKCVYILADPEADMSAGPHL
jgi:hypothetical protein